MKPINGNIHVKLVEDKSCIVNTNSSYQVVEIIALPFQDDALPPILFVGSRILVMYVKDFLVENEKVHFVNLADVVSVV